MRNWLGGGKRMAGSEKRKRNKLAHVRLSDEEHALLKSAADKTGLALGAYLRAAALDSPGPRAARKPPIRRQELVRLLGQIGKLGSNVNQIARALNTGDDPYGLVDDMKAASVEVAEMRAAILQALGRSP